MHFKTSPVVNGNSEFNSIFVDTYGLITANEPPISNLQITRSDSFSGGFTYFKICAESVADESEIERWTCNYNLFDTIYNGEARRDGDSYRMVI